ncbi:hypothetical protein ABK040_001554 [Willaertia magna]
MKQFLNSVIIRKSSQLVNSNCKKVYFSQNLFNKIEGSKEEFKTSSAKGDFVGSSNDTPYFEALKEGMERGSIECKNAINGMSSNFGIDHKRLGSLENQGVGVIMKHPFQDAIEEGAKYGSKKCQNWVKMWKEPQRPGTFAIPQAGQESTK